MDTAVLPAYRVIRHCAPVGGVQRALVDDGGGAAELLVIPRDSRGDWDEQVHIMAASWSDHVRTVRDLALDADGTMRVVRDLVPGETAAALLDRAGWCTPGRAVTLLYPLLLTVQEAHDRGFVLGGPGDSRIRITPQGRPVVADLMGAQVGAALPREVRDKDPGHARDIAALDALHHGIVRALDAGHHADDAATFPTLQDARDDPEVLLRWAEPEPLVGQAQVRDAPALGPDDDSVTSPSRESPFSSSTAPVSRVLRQLGVPADIVSRGHAAVSEVSAYRRRVLGMLSALPRRSLAVAAAVGAVLVAIVISVGLPTDADEPSIARTEGWVADAERLPEAADDDVAVSTGPSDPTSAIDPDDWGLLVHELIARWSACVTEQRVLCDEALQVGSIAASSRGSGQDAIVQRLEDLLARPQSEVTVTERSGDAVVVVASAPETAPASLLMIRSEAGWRVRDAWS
jgi:eukaryotic-like serine/threonine-protein kinase